MPLISTVIACFCVVAQGFVLFEEINHCLAVVTIRKIVRQLGEVPDISLIKSTGINWNGCLIKNPKTKNMF